jgi:hypothetical protein
MSDPAGSDPAGSAPDQSGSVGPGPRPSGLRNPAAAVRGVGAGTLAIEALVLLLAIQPIRVLGGDLSGAAIAVIVVLALASALLAGLLRRGWAWHAATGLQVLLLGAGLLHWSLAVLGLVFGLVWWYVLHVRRRILG